MQGDFGKFICEKRKAKGITLRFFAEQVGIAAAYESDIEKGHRYPPDKDRLAKMSELLGLSEEDTNKMYDLAAGEKENGIAPDLPEYVMGTDNCRVALRMAREKGLDNSDWQKIIGMIEKQKK